MPSSPRSEPGAHSDTVPVRSSTTVAGPPGTIRYTWPVWAVM